VFFLGGKTHFKHSSQLCLIGCLYFIETESAGS